MLAGIKFVVILPILKAEFVHEVKFLISSAYNIFI